MKVRINRLSGNAINAYLPALAQLRIRVFRDYPYLYEGSAEYEERYLQTYVDVPDSVMVLAQDGDEIVGAASGLPLAVETAETIAPFMAAGYDSKRVFYYGESVLLPEYRGRGLGNRFFEEREAHVRELARFDIICFCAIERPPHHPQRPPDYMPLDAFWHRRGFIKHPELHTNYVYRELGEAVESPKPMVFWLKSLSE
ncbi:MAG: GNAT family N-acetyltransferase [Synechococcaceae cyanobacterium SM1_2_3]|nr:GNAT family N-acetyltransferase [Synechococcaceae cyanobacterium SM1_2_3]